MNTTTSKSTFHMIGNLFVIALLILQPGIRGYKNWYWYEYLLFVFIPVAWLIYDIVQMSNKWLTFSRK